MDGGEGGRRGGEEWGVGTEERKMGKENAKTVYGRMGRGVGLRNVVV